MSAVHLLKPELLEARRIIRERLRLSDADRKVMNNCLTSSFSVWVGLRDEEIYCVWGVIPPTILSNRAYLWLYTDEEKVVERQFTFIRWSQIAVKQLLEEYDVLYGTVGSANEKTLRWLKWLGAEFERGLGGRLEFTIRRK